MQWNIADIVDAIEVGLQRRAAREDEEQVVRGFDALDEVEMHPIIHDALRAGGFGVHAEIRYPSNRSVRRKSEGKRCDLVLTSDGRPLQVEAGDANLFTPDDAVALDGAFWLEIKTVTQFTLEGPNPRYSAELLEPVRRDVAKLARDSQILHAGVLLVLFTADERVADNDLAVWHDRCLQKGYPTGVPSVRHVRIVDRIGHRVATAAVFPVYHL